MKIRRLIPAVLSVAALCVVTAVAFALKPIEFKSSLYDLVGSAADSIPVQVRDAASDVVPVLISSKDGDSAFDAAEFLSDNLPTGRCHRVRFRIDGKEFADVIDFCSSHSSGLLSQSDALELSTEASRAKFAKRCVRKAYSPLATSIFPLQKDPFFLASGFVTSLAAAQNSFKAERGFLTAHKDGCTHILLVMELEPALSGNIDALIGFSNEIEKVLASVRSEKVNVVACGTPMHSAYAASKCKFETTVLGIVSFLFVVFLSFYIFRSVKSSLLLLFLFLFAGLGGAAVVTVFFSSVHLVSLVFATTLLGFVIDYGYHWLLHAGDDKRKTFKGLVVSCVTTLISLLPLAFSSIPVLRQSAVFLGSGLISSLVCAVAFFPCDAVGKGRVKTAFAQSIAFRVLCLLFAAVSLCGMLDLHIGTSVSSMYIPQGGLARAERTLAEINSTFDSDRGFLVVGGSGVLEDLLQKEESLSLPPSVPRLSLFMPSLKVRRNNYSLVRKLYSEHSAKHSNALGLDKISLPPPPEPWAWEDIPDAMRGLFVRDGALIVSSAPRPHSDLPSDVVFCQPRNILNGILNNWTRETCVSLAVAFAAMVLLLMSVFRRFAFLTAMPSFAAIISVLGILSLSGVQINLFHLLAMFLLAGMGVDYAVFVRSCNERAAYSVTLAFLTSWVGFGALSFVSFPVVSAFGLSLGIGLPVAYSASLLLIRHDKVSEVGATSFGLEVIWLVYRLFGLRFLHFAAGIVGVFMWCFSPAVRRASPKILKVVNFTRSLADKMVVMADGKNLPIVKFDESVDAKSFLDEVSGRKGVFVLSSHVGTIEVLSAFGECNSVFHAWMEFEHTGVFNRFYMKHQRKEKVVIHPISEFSPGTVFFAGDCLDGGDVVLMAGDRSFGRKRIVSVGERSVELAEGVFRLAASLEHSVYFVSCISTGGLNYKVFVKKLEGGASQLACGYAAELLRLVDAYPMQNYSWQTA